MNPWQLLGVEPGSDRKTIKRAYTRLLKEVHPEEKPDEFMQLRQAYEWALSTLETSPQPMVFAVEQPVAPAPETVDTASFAWNDEATAQQTRSPAGVEDPWQESGDEPPPQAMPIHDDWADVPDNPDPEGNGDAAEKAEKAPPHRIDDQADSRQERLNRLVSAMSRLLDDPAQRNDPERWEPLLVAPELNDFQASQAVGGWLLPQVIRLLQSDRSECPLTPQVLVRLDDRFHWSTDNSGPLPVIEDQLLRVCLLIEAARETLQHPRQKMGWRWLGRSLFALSGRLSRVETLVGLGIATGTFALVALLSVVVEIPERLGLVAVALMLMMVYSTVSIAIKRVRDAGIHPLIAIVVGAIFPASWLFFLFAGPKDSDTVPDPRLNYSQAFDRSYRDYYVANDKRTWLKRLGERVSGIHAGIYLILAGVWGGAALLLSW